MANSTGLSLPSLVDRWYDFLDEQTDPRTKDWFLVESFSTLFLILASYVLFCVKVGPRMMRDRKPFELKEALIAYNFLNILVSLYIFYEGLEAGWLRDYSYKCQPVDYSNHPQALRMASVVWVYYMTKLAELVDTIFFVLRKKNNQVSFLHLYHHSLMPVCAYVGIRFLPGGHGTIIGLVNSVVHVVMYSYYLLAALGPAFRKHLWWKKYLTLMQLVQFVIVFVHLSQVLIRDCNYPKSLILLLCCNDILMIYLFSQFYLHAYVRKGKTA